MAPDQVSLDEPFDADLARREHAALHGFAYLLTADRARAGELARRAASKARTSGGHRRAIGERAYVVRRARKARASAEGSPMIMGLASLPHRERTVLVASLYDHASEAEISFMARCDVGEVASLLERALSRVAEALGEDPGRPGLSGLVRLEMHAAVEQLAEPIDEQDRAQRRPGWLKRPAFAGVIVALVATALTVTYGADESPPSAETSTFVHERAGFRLTVARTWRSISTTARGDADGVDPATLGLAIEEPSGDPALFIPRRARVQPAMLRISVTPSRSFDEDVAAFLDRIATRLDPPHVTSAIDEVASRPAIRFTIESDEDAELCSLCVERTWLVHWLHGTTLTIEQRIFGPTGTLLEEATRMIRSMRVVPGSMRYQPERGSLAPGLVVDEQLATLLQFLDARAMGMAPSAWLDDDAVVPRDLFDVHAYRVLGGADGTFEVSVERRDRLGRSLGTRDEMITVGPGIRRDVPWPMVVLEVEVIP